MKLNYWVSQSLGDWPSIIDKTRHGAKVQVSFEKDKTYLPVIKRTITFCDSFDLFQQATAPEGGRGMGDKS